MNDFKVSPKNLLLGILHTGNLKAMPIKVIIHLGALFGFSSNLMRVNVTRLLSDGALEQDERGYYRASGKNNLMSLWIDRWHLGEDRRRPWNRSWLLLCLPGKKAIASHKDTLRALSYMGFKASNSSMWVRPYNLVESRQIIFDHLLQLGLIESAELFVVSEASSEREQYWRDTLWPIEQYQQKYKQLLDELETSKNAIKKMPLDQAVVESFVLGSQVVNTLAIDPLLPEEMVDSQRRATLTDAMREYDQLGKAIWYEKMAEQGLMDASPPAHLNFLQ
ncbi:hypothetical protein MIB92_14970 [Aestuariirhabdus sp. Z084]|uniref:PaaX family transcriptional regulator C-terminal domain-containing protein n=1 Tax=Aestuariirhabdus haliotis TaxID=2918751 RepID=UPI00201B4317|nr:PaaX family transcriptional regulator C-terminal domain-containing protein [Aestuariirhabdus haliotis]MCL6416961.1 hypothetical protein [Aestuariirhabdus haliotis]MCL6420936.1 hypothetical protein [Aestuariirhabdus haliotis]